MYGSHLMAITSVSKKQCWGSVTEHFNKKAEFPRDQQTLNKKWDNLVQVHRSLFAEHLILSNKTVLSNREKSAVLSHREKRVWEIHQEGVKGIAILK
ncbi:hypothetical protein DPMN_014192 [Dreissena polymorpha]|uniref:Myb/SANT-like DNA-binding domain-containing protein n=1 Tax=Dreissena polymorpha TaxID=45954 RepID=A0A9D4N8Q1_DREPO|nr:hypothetical protein DPMN_014192 [Dreissena polymorpha]